MNFETFLSKARSVSNLSEAIDLPHDWDFPAIVFPGGLYCEKDATSEDQPFYYAEIGNAFYQSPNLADVARYLFEYACDEELLEGIE